MDLFSKVGFVKNSKAELEELFDSILKQAESVQGTLDLDIIYHIVSDNFQVKKISSLISVVSDDRLEVFFRHVNFGQQRVLSGINKNKKIALKDNAHYSFVEKNKKAIFITRQTSDYEKLFTDNEELFGELKTVNSIIAPLIINSEVIGYLEVISPRLEESDVYLVENFSFRLMADIANSILYQEIKASEQRYKDIFENAKEGFVVVNGRKRRFVEVNKAMCEITGYKSKELLSMDIIDLFSGDEQKKVQSIVRSRLEGKFGTIDAPINYLSKIRDKRGEIHHMKITIVRILNRDEWFSVFEDLTEQRKIQDALRASEEKYRKLIDDANDAVLIVNNQGQITFANNYFFKWSGYRYTDLEKLNIKLLFNSNNFDFISRLDVGQSHPTIDLEFRGKNDNLKYVSYSDTLITEKEKTIGLQIILRDITANKELEKKIIKSKKHYEQLIDTIQDSICVINKDAKFVSCNKSFAEKINYPIKQVKGTPCFALVPRYENDLFKNHCVKNKKGQLCMIKNVMVSKTENSFIDINVDDSGQSHYHRISLFPALDNDGEVYQVVMTIRDVTMRMEAEEKVKRLSEFNKRILDNVPISIIVLDRAGKILLINNAARKMINRDEKDILRTKLHESEAINRQDDLVKKYEKLLAKGEPFYYDNLPYYPKKFNRQMYLNVIAVPLVNSRGELEGAISMALDNTEAVLAKQRLEDLNRNLERIVNQRTYELDKANKELAKVLDLKSKFISDASHELRTPLTIIQGNLDLSIQEQKTQDKDVPEVYILIMKEVERMTAILADLTVLTNADSGAERFEYGPVYPELIVNDIVQSLGVLAAQKNISLKFVKGKWKNLFVMGDEMKVEKMIINIVRNAIRYTEEGGWVKISLSTYRDEVVVIVEDNGIGIPEKDLPYVFERFYRVDKARSRKEGGTGIGLAICEWIAKAHHGRIEVDSELGKGSKFSIFLPRDYKKDRKEIY